MTQPKRRKHTPESKAAIVRKVLKNRRPVSDVCEEHGIQVTQYYTWQRDAFERLDRVFEVGPAEQEKAEQAEMRGLKEKLNARTIFCRELFEAHARPKKLLGTFDWPLGST